MVWDVQDVVISFFCCVSVKKRKLNRRLVMGSLRTDVKTRSEQGL